MPVYNEMLAKKKEEKEEIERNVIKNTALSPMAIRHRISRCQQNSTPSNVQYMSHFTPKLLCKGSDQIRSDKRRKEEFVSYTGMRK